MTHSRQAGSTAGWRRNASLLLVLIAWLSQLLLPAVHERLMAQQAASGSLFFCGAVSSESLAHFATSAPTELLKALREAERKRAPKSPCELCASVHAQIIAASLSSSPSFFIAVAPTSVWLVHRGPSSSKKQVFWARGPPVVF